MLKELDGKWTFMYGSLCKVIICFSLLLVWWSVIMCPDIATHSRSGRLKYYVDLSWFCSPTNLRSNSSSIFSAAPPFLRLLTCSNITEGFFFSTGTFLSLFQRTYTSVSFGQDLQGLLYPQNISIIQVYTGNAQDCFITLTYTLFSTSITGFQYFNVKLKSVLLWRPDMLPSRYIFPILTTSEEVTALDFVHERLFRLLEIFLSPLHMNHRSNLRQNELTLFPHLFLFPSIFVISLSGDFHPCPN